MSDQSRMFASGYDYDGMGKRLTKEPNPDVNQPIPEPDKAPPTVVPPKRPGLPETNEPDPPPRERPPITEPTRPDLERRWFA
jgi:hypothetical protein